MTQKIGVLVIGRKRPGFDQQWNQIIRKQCDDAFASLGFDCVGADTPVVDDATIATVLEKIKDAKCDALIVLQPSLGNGQLAFTVAQHWADPIILWATPENPQGEKVSSCSLVAQHLWASILRQAKHPFEIVYGDPNVAETRQALSRAVALAHTVKRLKHSKLGVIGSHAPGYMPMQADPFLLRRQIGLQLHDLSLPQFIDRVREIDEKQVKEDVQRIAAMKLPMNGVSSDDLAMQSRCYLAVRQIIAEESLDAIALQEWPELPNVLGQWPYLAISRLTGEGMPLAIEGDADGAAMLFIGDLISAGIGYLTDWIEHDQYTIHIWHPGMAPMQMCDAPSFGKHFNIEKPMVVDAPLKANRDVTLARLWHCDGEYHLMAFEGRTITPKRKLTGNAGLIEVKDRDVRELFDELLHAGLPHHVVMFEGFHSDALRRLARMLGICYFE